MKEEIAIERYRFILSQIGAVNENVHRYLALYQTFTTTIIGGALVLFVNYQRWGIDGSEARSGIFGALALESLVAAFSCLMVVMSAASWFDYRKEECELTDEFAYIGFRRRPRLANFHRWYETHVLAFIVVATIAVWIFFLFSVLPDIH